MSKKYLKKSFAVVEIVIIYEALILINLKFNIDDNT